MATRQDRKTYSFKSVGDLTENLAEAQYNALPTPVGIMTPLQMGNGTNIYKMHYSLQDQIRDNLRNLVLTNKGERLGRPDFGANLLELVMELGDESGDQKAMIRIKDSVSKYLPFVNLVGFATETDHFDNKEVAKIVLFLTYTIPRISNKQHGLRVTLYSAG
jgi:phage baseplate assembly protein W